MVLEPVDLDRLLLVLGETTEDVGGVVDFSFLDLEALVAA